MAQSNQGRENIVTLPCFGGSSVDTVVLTKCRNMLPNPFFEAFLFFVIKLIWGLVITINAFSQYQTYIGFSVGSCFLCECHFQQLIHLLDILSQMINFTTWHAGENYSKPITLKVFSITRTQTLNSNLKRWDFCQILCWKFLPPRLKGNTSRTCWPF